MDNMKRLTEIGTKYNTDKATGHGFTEFYDDYVVKYANPNILEIGVYYGASLKMWEEYFGSPFIVGVDIEEKSIYDNENIKTIVADQGDPTQLLRCVDICKEYQIIIDDGSHLISHQISTFATLFPYLASGGVYFLEDLHTSFIGGDYNPKNDAITAYNFLHLLCNEGQIDTPYATAEQIQYIRENVAEVKLFQLDGRSFIHSMTSAIVKK